MSEERRSQRRGANRCSGGGWRTPQGLLIFPLIAILISFVIGAIIMLATGNNPVEASGRSCGERSGRHSLSGVPCSTRRP